MMSRNLIALSILPLLGACNTPVDEPPYMDPAFGEAVYRNMAVQMANPPPVEAEALPPAEGNRRALMLQRYRTDTVEPLIEETTRDED